MKKATNKLKTMPKLPNWASFAFLFLIKCVPRCFYRIKIENPNKYLASEEHFVIVTWHNRLMFLLGLFSPKVRKRTKAVVSASRDGQYVSDVLKLFGLQIVRGSSSYKGANAQLGAFKAIKAKWHVCFTPDGPRGPKYHMHPGPVHLAAKTGCRIVPVVVNASRYWQLKSWDNFQVPKPFCTLTLVVGEPLTVPGNISSKEDLEIWRKKVQEHLLKITIDKA